ncbi:MAG: hypothetical protein IJK33_04075 [Clostridia bacterium]|nr:hypothetical protein [Clostridia bacterium]
MGIYSELTGAWEERGIIGIRIEINRRKLTVLWRNSPVLRTKYKAVKTENGYELALEERGLRYEGSDSDYASVTRLSYAEGRLTFEELFPITGPSTTVLTSTENSRYGDYTVCDNVLKELQGKWKEVYGSFELVFEKDTLYLFGRTIKIHVLHSNYERAPEREFLIVDADPSKYELYGMTRITYDGDTLRSSMIICDAPPHEMIFIKER